MKKYILILILSILYGGISYGQIEIRGQNNTYLTLSQDTISPIVMLTTMGFSDLSKEVYLNIVLENKNVVRLKKRTNPIIDGQYTTIFFVIKKSDYLKIKNSYIKHIILFDVLKEKKLYVVQNNKIKL